MRRGLAALAALALLTACGGEEGRPAAAPGNQDAGEGGDGRAVGSGLTAVATVFPLAWLAGEIAPEADVASLGARGQDPHDLELSPDEREAIETADVLLYMGDLDFQPQIEVASGSARGAVVDVTAVVDETRLLALDDPADDVAHGDHDDEVDHDDHDRGDLDPHVWFDAALMAEVAEAIGDVFAATDPDGARDYERNAARVAEELRRVHGEIDELLSDCRHDTAIVSHEAYAYLLEPRGLRQEGISGPGGHGEASPQRLAELTEHIRTEGIPAVAAEPIEGRADAEALAREAGVDLVEIDPLEVVAEDAGYPDLLRQQAEAFAVALDCR